tara:strand:+ start:1211 stop:1504 length:294 start_codon:yes stop_codon:yes gene_type:complete
MSYTLLDKPSLSSFTYLGTALDAPSNAVSVVSYPLLNFVSLTKDSISNSFVHRGPALDTATEVEFSVATPILSFVRIAPEAEAAESATGPVQRWANL